MTAKLSLPRICVSATGRTPAELLECARRALPHSRFVELRLDWVAHPLEVLPQIPPLLRSSRGTGKTPAVILLATCRRAENGGRFAGSVSEQLEILHKAAEAGCQLVDVELESAEAVGARAVATLRESAKLILSFHNFQQFPEETKVVRRLVKFPADFYKLVPTASHQSDNCRVLTLLVRTANEAGQQGKWVAFCMGEAGVPSRVLALSRGSAFVYAACPPSTALPGARLEEEQLPQTGPEVAAPGQLDASTLQGLYRVEKLTSDTAIYGLLGCPVRHSVGAAVHNAAFQASKQNAVYLPLLAADLKDFRTAAERYPLAGFSVTIPHKKAILRWVDRADRTVGAVGAANTVRVRRGRWEAINTDVEGVAQPLRQRLRLGERGFLPGSFRTVIVGNGGAARAAVIALAQIRCRNILLTGRNPVKVRRLANELGAQQMPLERLEKEPFDLLIHATPVGMWPHAQESLLLPEQLNAGMVFDLVYNPVQTRLLRLARDRGCRTISGLEMFLAQAARQFKFWTEAEAPRRRMRTAALAELARFPSSGFLVEGY